MDSAAADLSTPDAIYAHIGRSIAAIVPEPWVEIRLSADIGSGSVGLRGDYTPAERGSAKTLEVGRLSYNVAKAFRNLQKITKPEAGQAWNRAAYTLNRSGEFKIDFSFDEQYAGELERIAGEPDGRFDG